MPKAWISESACVILAIGLFSCATTLPPVVIQTPGRDHPVGQAVADQVKPGMSVDDVIRLAGKASAAGGVEPASAGEGSDVYSVFSDPGATPDWANSTWLYLIVADGKAASVGGQERYLFVEIKAGRVERAYQGRVAEWSM